jgi:hypothetical protein
VRRSLVASIEEVLQGWLQVGPAALTEASEPATCVHTRRRFTELCFAKPLARTQAF